VGSRRGRSELEGDNKRRGGVWGYLLLYRTGGLWWGSIAVK
jgi:hypothetical protein